MPMRERNNFNLGIVVFIRKNENIFSKPQKYKLKYAQLINWEPKLWEEIDPIRLREDAKKHEIQVNSFWVGYSGPIQWNFNEGPSTIGIVPPEYREMRTKELLAGANFASKFGARAIVTHLGFLPENPKDPQYPEIVNTVKRIATRCQELGIEFWFETGQETPVTLLRLIEDVGLENLGINLDPANLILYGKANPVDALDVFGKYVKSLHIKDGFYPTNGRELGKEAIPGKGKVNFPALINGLKSLNFKGDLIIERELKGGDADRDILSTIKYLESMI